MRFLRNDNFGDEVGGYGYGKLAVFFATDLADFSGFQRILFGAFNC